MTEAKDKEKYCKFYTSHRGVELAFSSQVLEDFVAINRLVSGIDVCAGDGRISRASGLENLEWKNYDIDPSSPEVEMRDALLGFAASDSTLVATNPPYKQLGSHNLYMDFVCVILRCARFAAILLPASALPWLIQHHRERLYAVIQFTDRVFEDAQVVGALFIFQPPSETSPLLYRDKALLGRHAEFGPTPQTTPSQTEGIECNVVGARLCLQAFDNGSPIHFFVAPLGLQRKVDKNQRLIMGFEIEGMSLEDLNEIAEISNELFWSWRKATHSLFLAFMLREKGLDRLRWRLGINVARGFLKLGIEELKRRRAKS